MCGRVGRGCGRVLVRIAGVLLVGLDLCAIGYPAVILATRPRVYGYDDVDPITGIAALVRLRAVPQVQEVVLTNMTMRLDGKQIKIKR